MKKTLKIVANTLVILVIILAFLLHGFQLFGLVPYCVLSGSMESVYPTGSLLYVVKTDPGELEVDDIITFKLPNGSIATHRIIELIPDESSPNIIRFRTKGDENNIADGTLVDFNSVIGTPVFCIPFLGYLATYIMYPPGRYIALTIAVALILLEIILTIALEDKDSKNASTAEQ